ncbi:MAG: glycerophosphodiester phosphodiesterase [Acidobacteriota bacterium]
MLLDRLESGFLNIAHRGARSIAPENTLAAARKGFEAGADMWELDVCMTADGELIVVHDASLDRTSNVKEVFPNRSPWLVDGFTLEEIRRLDFGSWFNRDDPFGQIGLGFVSAEDRRAYEGEAAPTLREALSITLEWDRMVNVEIKDLGRSRGHDEVAERVVSTIREMGMADRVLVSSFNHSYLRRVLAADGSIATGALVESHVPDALILLRSLGAVTYHPRAGTISDGEIERHHRLGVKTLVWTVNDERQMESLIRCGASGIFTDFPRKLAKMLTASG